MKTLLSIIFVILLSLVTLHDAHSKTAYVGFHKSTALTKTGIVYEVKTNDGEIFPVRSLEKTPGQINSLGKVDTDNGKTIRSKAINTYFLKAKTRKGYMKNSFMRNGFTKPGTGTQNKQPSGNDIW